MKLSKSPTKVVMDDANLDLCVPAITFSCVGTAGSSISLPIPFFHLILIKIEGQRCTTTRRLIVHERIYDQLVGRIVKAFKQIESRIGDPLDERTLVGPLHNPEAVLKYKSSVAEAIALVSGFPLNFTFFFPFLRAVKWNVEVMFSKTDPAILCYQHLSPDLPMMPHLCCERHSHQFAMFSSEWAKYSLRIN